MSLQLRSSQGSGSSVSRVSHTNHSRVSSVLSRNTVNAILSTARNHNNRREAGLPQIDDANQYSSGDDDNDTADAPKFQHIHRVGGNQALVELTNFNRSEFEELWSLVQPHVETRYNVGRGRKTKETAKDMFLQLLYIMKVGPPWDEAARVWGRKGPSFEKSVVSFAKIVAPKAYQELVLDAEPDDIPPSEFPEASTDSFIINLCRYS